MVTLLAGCGGVQSALVPAGRDAERIAALFWTMTAASLAIWAFVVVLAAYAGRNATPVAARTIDRFVVIAGVIVPTLLLTVLLVQGLALLPRVLAPGAPGITVTGEQWWFRVRYDLPDGRSFELANELALPVGRRTALTLVS